MDVIDDTSHLYIPRVIHSDLGWLFNFLLLWLGFKAEDMATLVLIFLLAANVIDHVIVVPLSLPRARPLRLHLAIHRAVQLQSFFLELILKETARRFGRVDHTNSLRAFLPQHCLKFVRPLIESHVRIIL